MEMAHRLAQLIKRICKYAKGAGYTEYNIAEDIIEVMNPKPAQTHMACITDPRELGILLNTIDNYKGDFSVKYALKILPYVFTRSGELRGAKWDEFDFEQSFWFIPANRMKMCKPHFVPLSRQVKDMLFTIR